MNRRRRPASGLTPESFERLLRALGGGNGGDGGDGGNIEKGAARYEALRRKLIELFRWRGCASPETLADETFDRVARRLAENVQLESPDPASYVYGVAHLVYREAWRHEIRERMAMTSGEVRPQQVDDSEPDPRLDDLRRCLDKLDVKQRHLVLEYHRGENNIEHRKKLADELGIPINALRIRVFRLRRRLEECLAARPDR